MNSVQEKVNKKFNQLRSMIENNLFLILQDSICYQALNGPAQEILGQLANTVIPLRNGDLVTSIVNYQELLDLGLVSTCVLNGEPGFYVCTHKGQRVYKARDFDIHHEIDAIFDDVNDDSPGGDGF